MKKKFIVLLGILTITFLLTFFYNDRKEKQTRKENASENSFVSDSIRKARSNEIKKALMKESNEFSPLDYAFMINEFQELNFNDTLVYAITPDLSEFPHTIPDSIFFSSGLGQLANINPNSTYVYMSLPTSATSLSQSNYISDVATIEQISSALKDSSYFGTASNPLGTYFLEHNKIDITKIPDEHLTNDLSELEENIRDFAFSEVVGEEEIMDFLIKDPENTLKVIEKDSFLLNSFNYWLADLDEVYFTDDYPAELQARKLEYLITELKKIELPIAEKTWKKLDSVEIVKIE